MDKKITLSAPEYQQRNIGYSDCDLLEIAILEHTLNGVKVCVSGTYGPDGPEVEYDPIDIAAVISHIGQDAYESLRDSDLDSGSYGYAWWEALASGDTDTIRETIGIFS